MGRAKQEREKKAIFKLGRLIVKDVKIRLSRLWVEEKPLTIVSRLLTMIEQSYMYIRDSYFSLPHRCEFYIFDSNI